MKPVYLPSLGKQFPKIEGNEPYHGVALGPRQNAVNRSTKDKMVHFGSDRSKKRTRYKPPKEVEEDLLRDAGNFFLSLGIRVRGLQCVYTFI